MRSYHQHETVRCLDAMEKIIYTTMWVRPHSDERVD
jgi:hypothetical protein